MAHHGGVGGGQIIRSLIASQWNLPSRLITGMVSRSSEKVFRTYHDKDNIFKLYFHPFGWRTLLRSANYAYLALGIVRFMITAIYFNWPSILNFYFRFDPLMRIAYHTKVINQFGIMSISPIPIFVVSYRRLMLMKCLPTNCGLFVLYRLITITWYFTAIQY